MKPYEPTPRIAEMLNSVLRRVEALPYPTTARWVFYRIAQEFGAKKGDYKKFLKWTSQARKRFWNGWHPALLVDDTRKITSRGGGYASPEEWIKSFWDSECYLSVQDKQSNILLVLFEAAAMHHQFDYYLGPLRIPCSPFGGDASIRHKWNIAKYLEDRFRTFKKPVVVLYYGDFDPKGMIIPRSAMKDIWKWINCPELGSTLGGSVKADSEVWKSENDMFRWIRVGLFRNQTERLGIPENPDKPGTYQWEGAEDEAARSLIYEGIEGFWDTDIIRETEEVEDATTKRWRKLLDRSISESDITES